MIEGMQAHGITEEQHRQLISQPVTAWVSLAHPTFNGGLDVTLFRGMVYQGSSSIDFLGRDDRITGFCLEKGKWYFL